MSAATERPAREPAIQAMVDAGDKVEEALRTAWPIWWDAYQNGGPHPVQTAANVLHRQLVLLIHAAADGEASAEKVLAEEHFFLQTTETASAEMAAEGKYTFPKLGARVQ